MSNFSNLDEYSVGSEDRFEINLEVHNHGEDAYEATFYLNLPEAVNYVKTEVMEGYGEISHGSIPVLCSPPTLNNNFVLKCDLGNPMEANSKVRTASTALTKDAVNKKITNGLKVDFKITGE